jgi:hypothetical protein
MISNDVKRELNLYVENFIKGALHNNYAVINDTILEDIEEKINVKMDQVCRDEITDYIYDLIKTDTRVHFYGIGEAYNYNGEFREIADNPIITSKVFDNPFDAKFDEK